MYLYAHIKLFTMPDKPKDETAPAIPTDPRKPKRSAKEKAEIEDVDTEQEIKEEN